MIYIYIDSLRYRRNAAWYAIYRADDNKYLGLISNAKSVEDAKRKATYLYNCEVRLVCT